jgi:succinyl-CoA synthetase beta subunit
VLGRLYDVYRAADAELVEVNPLVLTGAGAVVALDAKVSLDPGATPRHSDFLRDLVSRLPDTATEPVRQARALGLVLIEFDGCVGVLANGAGLTMTTLDAVNHYGGRPANFLEIGGDAYTKATPALRLVLDNPRVRSLVVNFCGAFARTDVMAEGVVNAIEELAPSIPIFFCIHGTGEEEAIRLVRERLQIEPYDLMDDAVKAAVGAADRRPSEVA